MTSSPSLNTIISRRKFLRAASATAFAGYGLTANGAANSPADQRIVVGAHPWVYAAAQPDYEITPFLPQIFANMRYAGLDGIELMHTALRPEDAVERIDRLSHEHQLAVIGTSFGGAMWDRQQHDAVLDDAELIVPRLAKLGGRTLGVSVGAVKWGDQTPKTPEQLDAQADVMSKIFAVCRRHSVVPNLHNHTYEVENNLHDLRGTLARLPGTKLGPDLNWLVRGGVQPVAFLKEYGSQIVFLHLRDQHQDGRWSDRSSRAENQERDRNVKSPSHDFRQLCA